MKLLRVVQEKVISRVGGQDDIAVNVRIISATHRDLEKMIEDRKFREDLYFRLNATIITLPPLRDRLEDLKELVPYFAVKYAREFEIAPPSIHRDAMKRLTDHRWPGNIRELENIIRRALIECRGMTISRDLVERLLQPRRSPSSTEAHASGPSLQGFEEHNNRSSAALRILPQPSPVYFLMAIRPSRDLPNRESVVSTWALCATSTRSIERNASGTRSFISA